MRPWRSQQIVEVVIDAAEINSATRSPVGVVVVRVVMMVVVVQTIRRAQQRVPVQPRDITN